MPWVYVRDQLAQRYGCLPRAIDAEPHSEITTMLRLASIESEIAAERKRQRRDT